MPLYGNRDNCRQSEYSQSTFRQQRSFLYFNLLKAALIAQMQVFTTDRICSTLLIPVCNRTLVAIQKSFQARLSKDHGKGFGGRLFP